MPLPSGPGVQPRAASAVLGRREPLLQVLLPDVPVEFVAAAEQQAAGHALQRHGEPPSRRGTRLQVFRGPPSCNRCRTAGPSAFGAVGEGCWWWLSGPLSQWALAGTGWSWTTAAPPSGTGQW